MPTYTYRCKACSYQFEEFQKISDDPLVRCPSCNREALVRIIAGGVGLVFKGSGFYRTDYKNKSSTEGEKQLPDKTETKTKPKTESTSETKAESKPAENKASE
ncbi:MAG: zinc ribbon domain-containing protein [Ignavibacteriae bacterium]|nr:zinc ribbon domain-containing protein [Ignavibacteriota bacterium]